MLVIIINFVASRILKLDLAEGNNSVFVSARFKSGEGADGSWRWWSHFKFAMAILFGDLRQSLLPECYVNQSSANRKFWSRLSPR